MGRIKEKSKYINYSNNINISEFIKNIITVNFNTIEHKIKKYRIFLKIL